MEKKKKRRRKQKQKRKLYFRFFFWYYILFVVLVVLFLHSFLGHLMIRNHIGNLKSDEAILDYCEKKEFDCYFQYIDENDVDEYKVYKIRFEDPKNLGMDSEKQIVHIFVQRPINSNEMLEEEASEEEVSEEEASIETESEE